MQRRALRSVLALLAVTLPSVGVGLPAGEGATDVSAEPYSGTWAQIRVQTAVVDFPVLGPSKVQTTSIVRLRMTPDGRSLSIAGEACSVEHDTGLSLVRVLFPEALVRRPGRFDGTASLRREGDQLQFFQARQWLLFGADLDDDAHDSLPTEAVDERVVDHDGDGNPGITVRLEGVLSADLYMVQRSWATLRGTAGTSDRIDGLIQWGEEHTVLGSTSVLLRSLPVSHPDPEPGASYFRTTRIEASKTCADILAEQESLFAR